jgi:hypothetical protein
MNLDRLRQYFSIIEAGTMGAAAKRVHRQARDT